MNADGAIYRLDYAYHHGHGNTCLDAHEAYQIAEVIRAQQEQIAYLTAERDNALSAAPGFLSNADLSDSDWEDDIERAERAWQRYAESRAASQATRRAC